MEIKIAAAKIASGKLITIFGIENGFNVSSH
jgi:hypothetical protein